MNSCIHEDSLHNNNYLNCFCFYFVFQKQETSFFIRVSLLKSSTCKVFFTVKVRNFQGCTCTFQEFLFFCFLCVCGKLPSLGSQTRTLI